MKVTATRIALALCGAFALAGCNEDYVCQENERVAKLKTDEKNIYFYTEGDVSTGIYASVEIGNNGNLYDEMEARAKHYCATGKWPGLNAPAMMPQ